jgi:hypothetical protein
VNNSPTLEEPIGPAAFVLFYKSLPIVEPMLLRQGMQTQVSKADTSRIWTAMAQPYQQADDDVIVISDDDEPMRASDALPVGRAIQTNQVMSSGTRFAPSRYAGFQPT